MAKRLKIKGPTKEALQRRLLEAEASVASAYAFASQDVETCSEDTLMGSGVVLSLSGIGGNRLVGPVMIRDGLSSETIKAIQKDLLKSYSLATLYKPKGEN